MTPYVAPAGAPKNELRTDIQALRGFAVLAVVLYHAGLPLPAGYLGVDVFFVISGFLITGLIAKSIDAHSFSFASFYYRRAKRLLPAAFLVLGLTLIAAPFCVSDSALDELRGQAIGAITFSSNFIFWQQAGYFDSEAATKPLLHFWSLSLEEQYYLVMPALLAFAPRKAWLAIIAVILAGSAALTVYLLTIDPSAAFYLLPSRAWQLALGSFAALVASRFMGAPLLSWLRVPALIVLLATPAFPIGGPHPGVDSAIVCLATLVLILGATGGEAERSPPVRAVAWVGNFSYSLYLVHWPVLVLMRARWPDLPEWGTLAALAASIALSLALYTWIEEPFRRSFTKARISLTSGLATAAAVLVAGSLYVTAPSNGLSAFASTFTPSTGDPLADADFRHIFRPNYGLGEQCSANGPVTFADIVELCRTTARPRVILWGDSNAMMWGEALGRQLGPRGMLQATRPSCAPMYGEFVNPHADAARARSLELCRAFNADVLAYVERTPSIEIVVLSSSYAQPAQLQASYVVLARELRAAGKRVVMLGPIPFTGDDYAQCQERLIRGLVSDEEADCRFPETEWRRRRRHVLAYLDRAAAEAAIPVVWPTTAMCAEAVCVTRRGNTLLFRDAAHLSYDGAAVVAGNLGLADRLVSAAR